MRSRPDPDRYLGRGKLAEVKAEIARSDANLVACDDELVPRQERNLEAALGVPVIDRTAVILDIFADHAHSAEGKLQVELAQLEYNLARMRGLWTHLERLGGGIGTRGPGETQIETDRRLARDRIATLRRRLERLEQNRQVMRARRRDSALPTVALAGYTNAGKSTLLNALTGAGAGVGERLFHTLDPTTRAYRHQGRRYLVTDTVGFIRKLPHQLVEAFKATLEETVLADLIVHVVDASEPEEWRRESIAAVDSALEEIGAGESPRLVAFNKIDLLDAAEVRRADDPRARGDRDLRRHRARASRSCGIGSEVRSRRRCGLWSCCSPTPREGYLPSFTNWRATSSARTAPRGSWSGPGSPPRWPTGSRTLRETASGPASDPDRDRLEARSTLPHQWSFAVRLLRKGARLPSRAHDGRRRASTCMPWSRRPSGRGSGPASAPESRSRFLPATPAWCCHAPAWPPSMGSRWSTRPG